MKVCINLLEKKSNIGPVIFANRLAKELEKQRVKVVNRTQKHDVLLAIIKDENLQQSKKKGAKIVQRLDGIYYYKDQNYLEQNKPIEKTFNESDAVIYQSNFNKIWVEDWFGKKKNSFIIPNGADPNLFRKRLTLRKKIFLCSAKWRHMKRLDSIVKGFNLADISNAELHILGKPDVELFNDKIIYFGEVPSKNLYSFYNNSNFFIHIAYSDNCPNSVVEALVCGLPVVCASSGGTKELVKNSGEIVQEESFKFKPINSWEIPPLSHDKVASSLISCLENEKKYVFPREDLYIQNIAKKYIEVFERVLDSD